ncbi:MAG: TraR/DksA C4-type zinc finger protein [Halobacteriovoraceae bacterium]|nr:TraR/DksA C4-type zinc finger protein [Halobacteriovoraceae bacterium]
MKRENSYLTDAQIKNLQNELLKNRRLITEYLKKNTISYDIEKNDIKNCVDETSKNLIVYHSIRLAKPGISYLKDSKKSLKKIKEGEYGLCDKCGSQIPFSRLRAKLLIELCIVCIEDKEVEKAAEIKNICNKFSCDFFYFYPDLFLETPFMIKESLIKKIILIFLLCCAGYGLFYFFLS